jgi:Spy/CpxP family protein refolding chaperone
MHTGIMSKRGMLSLVVAAALLVPNLVLAKDKGWEHYKERKMQIIKTMNLSPEKAKEFEAIDEKYTKDRKGIFSDLRKNASDLKQAFSMASPDEVKVKGLVNTFSTLQDNLFESYKAQRGAELALLTPLQQGRYLLALGQLRHELMEEHEHK